MNQPTMNIMSFESLYSFLLSEMEACEKNYAMNIVLILVFSFELCKDVIVEHDITSLLSSLQIFYQSVSKTE